LQEAVDLRKRVIEVKTSVLRVNHTSLLVLAEAPGDIRVELAVESDEAPSCAAVESPTIAASAGQKPVDKVMVHLYDENTTRDFPFSKELIARVLSVSAHITHLDPTSHATRLR
jgi:hypothetical protein